MGDYWYTKLLNPTRALLSYLWTTGLQLGAIGCARVRSIAIASMVSRCGFNRGWAVLVLARPSGRKTFDKNFLKLWGWGQRRSGWGVSGDCDRWSKTDRVEGSWGWG